MIRISISRRPRPSALATLCATALAAALPVAARAEVESIDEVVQLALADADDALDVLSVDDASMGFAAGELVGERVVKGAPYCADAVHESVQALSDGNRIVRKQQSRLCRDGDGRTRQEVERNGRKLVWLSDPVARQAWLLDPERKTARRIGMHGPSMAWHESAMDAADADAWREFAERTRERAQAWAERAHEMAREWKERVHGPAAPSSAPAAQAAQPARPAQPPLPPLPPVPPTPVLITRAPVASDAPGKPMEVQVLRFADDSGVHGGPPGMRMMLPMPSPMVHLQAMHAAPRGPGDVSALGAKDFDGVRANGERTTWTIPAGRIGNEKPIVITREVWTSPDLLLTVQMRDADPRRGETVYRLANLKRGEPDPSLMKVPADYSTSGSPAALPRKPGAGASGPKG